MSNGLVTKSRTNPTNKDRELAASVYRTDQRSPFSIRNSSNGQGLKEQREHRSVLLQLRFIPQELQLTIISQMFNLALTMGATLLSVKLVLLHDFRGHIDI